ncbi:hypothetical protein [uncultured Tateyamaria sp.]|uniref:hypothetical protein n=1 Tax=uncultured Tateyamaria sp. TaxID=455651 RepID=UPI00261EAEBE|nr:hypothetical protein [uncultured Tateyamaria sp.]
MSEFRISIDGQWWSRDFHTFFRDLEVLARLAETGELGFALDGEWNVDTGGSNITIVDFPGSGNTETNRRIQVTCISFASPGFTDLSGAGKMLEQVRLFLEFIITKVLERNDRHLEREEKRLKIELLRQHISALEPPSDLNPEMLKVLENHRADALIASVAEGRVTGISGKMEDAK